MKLAWIALLLAVGGWAGEITYEQLIDLDTKPRKITYKTVGTTELQLHVYTPRQKPQSPLPAILVIHGGGWGAPGPANMAHMCRYLARRGMVAINMEYRLVSKKTTVRIPDCLADCRDALDYIRAHAKELGVDPRRIAVAGDSAGGHLAAALALSMGPDDKPFTPPHAAVLLNPCVDLVGLKWMKNHAGIAPTPDTPKTESWDVRAGRVSPIAHVKKGLPPILLIHGVDDGVVPVQHADAFHKKVRRAQGKIKYHRMKDWGHAFIVPNYGKPKQIVKTLQLTDVWLAKLGYLKGKPQIVGRWEPPAYHPLFTPQEEQKPYVKARSFDFHDYPYLDGQWQGIITDSDDNTWFSISSHSGIHHAQVFRYSPKHDKVDHVADLGQVVGEKLTELSDGVPEGKIHSNMFEDGDVIYCATTDAHRLHDEVYTGGYWLAIHRQTGKIENLGRTITKDGLLCAGYDYNKKLMYGHTNVKGLLTCFDPKTRKEEVLGFPHQGSPYPWPRGLCLMFTEDGRVYGGRPPGCSFWEYDPKTKKFRTFRPDMPDPVELKDADEKMKKQWHKSAIHLSIWNEKDQCFYMVRSFDEMLMRFYPPKQAGGKARIEALHRLRPPGLEMRYGLRAASCTLAMHDRTIWYTPNTAWGGVTHLVSYNIDKKEWKHYGPIVVEGKRRINEVHSLSVGRDGKLYMVAFVFSIKGIDPVRPYAMRDKYPFHPRFVIVDPAKHFRMQAKE